MIWMNLRRYPLVDIKYESVYVDTETTGLNHNTDEIIEVCAIKFDNRNGDILDMFYSLCCPMSGKISEGASNVNGITMDKVRDQPHYLDIRDDLGEFIGERVLIGHNLIGFDIKFLKIRPREIEDTLMMCRKKWTKQNKLILACRRLGIKFSETEAHTAEYDVRKGIELYIALRAMDDPERQNPTIFDAPEAPAAPADPMPTQVYSYSRINLFQQCPFKWKQIYLLKNKEPASMPLVTGKTMHKVCELAATWSYAQTFANKFRCYAKAHELKKSPKLMEIMDTEIKKDHPFYLPDAVKDINWTHIGMYLYLNPGYMGEVFGKTITEVLNYVSENCSEDDYETVSMPDRETYNKLIQYALVIEKCIDPEHIKDVQWLADWFYEQKDFTLYSGEMALVEKKLNFDKDWKLIPDFFDNSGYMRGVIDVIEYNGSFVTIIDYKTGRKMLSAEELKHDLQMKVYVLLLMKYLPKDTCNKVVVKHHYVRYGKTIEVEIEDPKSIVAEAQFWIDESIHDIEREMLKDDNESFKPCRNEFCHMCFLKDNNTCPLFNVKHINDIEDPQHFEVKSVADVRQAWKKVEVNGAESTNLTSKCKAFINDSAGRPSIDKEATLDFWVKETRTFNAAAMMKLLIKKGKKLSDFAFFLGLTQANYEKLCKKLKLELTENELNEVSKISKRTEFKALTKKAAKDYLNG